MDLRECDTTTKMRPKKLEREKLKCTCPIYNQNCANDTEVTCIETGGTETNAGSNRTKGNKKSYKRSISLGQIIAFPVEESEHLDQPENCCQKRDLTDFEKDNLLFLKELKAKREEQQQFLEKQVSELPYLAFPRARGNARQGKAQKNFLQKETFPLTAFHPSKVSSSEILRSVSLEESESHSESSSSDDQKSPVIQQISNGVHNRNHEANWRRIEDFLLQSGISRKPRANCDNLAPSDRFMHLKNSEDNDGRLASKRMHIFRSFSSPVRTSHHPIDELWPLEDNECNSNSQADNDYIQDTNRPHSSNLDDYDNLRSLQQWLTESIADTTQRNVHDAKIPKGKEPELGAKEATSNSCPTSTNLVTKPPSGVQGSQPSSGPQSPTESGPSVTEGGKKACAMAFTVDFGDSGTSDSSGSVSANKRLEISGPISQFAPKHRRNQSLNKVDEDKKVEERKVEKPPVGRPRINTAGANAVCTRRGGYHSEGYFSSDQEDEAARKADLKSPRSPKSAGLPSANRVTSGETQKSNVLRKSYGRPEGRTCCKERKPSVPELNGRLNRSQEKINSPKSDTESSRRNSKSSPTSSDPSKDDQDDDSDAGTYTIDKDSPEVEAARNNIGRAFGVITESDAELTSSTAVPNSTTDHVNDEESWLSASENQKLKASKTVSRNSPNWIQQWAESVAEQTKPVMKCMPSRSPVTSPRTHKSDLTPQSSLQDNLDVRPRRKLPTPPQYPSPRNYPKDILYEGAQQSIPKTKPKSSKSFRNYFESQESGGDSDLDFRSYSFTEDERLTASLRDKLRLTGLNASSPKNLPSPRTSPRRFDPLKAAQTNNLSEDVFSGKLSEQSDSSSETSEPYKEPNRICDNNPPLKFNRAFSLRRARLNCDDAPKQQQVIEKKKNTSIRPSSAGNVRKVPSSSGRAYQSVDSSSVSSCRSFACGPVNSVVRGPRPYSGGGVRPSDNMIRSDGGRFSLRLSRSASSSAVKSPSKANTKRESTLKKASKSNSTLSTKEVEFQNWKRRKNYDPMKAAAEGRKKQIDKRETKNSDVNDLNSGSLSPHNSLLRSASFHGTNGLDAERRWANKLSNHLQYTSEEDGPLSLEEEVPRRVSSPLRRSPTSPNQMYSRHHYSQGPPKSFRTPIESVEENATPHFQVSARKVSMEESGSEGKMSPLNSQGSGRGNRPKTKMEALDNLVISTIHSLSVKVRTTAESLLLKLKSQYDEEGERASLLQEVLAHLSESDQSLATQSRSTSRELAGILRNLKKVEHALQVVDRVMIGGQFIDDDEAEDIPNDWGESDY